MQIIHLQCIVLFWNKKNNKKSDREKFGLEMIYIAFGLNFLRTIPCKLRKALDQEEMEDRGRE